MDKFAEIYAQAVILHQSHDSLTAAAKVDSMLAANDWWMRDKIEAVVARYQQDQTQWQEFWGKVVENLEQTANPSKSADSTDAASISQK